MPVIEAEFLFFKFNYFNPFFSNFSIDLLFKINILLCLIFFQLFLSSCSFRRFNADFYD